MPFGANFFSRGESRRRSAREEGRKQRPTRARAARSQNAMLRNSTFHRHFCTTSKFLRANTFAGDLSPRISPAIAIAEGCRSGKRRLHTKLSGVTVIFFLL